MSVSYMHSQLSGRAGVSPASRAGWQPALVPSCGTPMARHTGTRGDAAQIHTGRAGIRPHAANPHGADAVLEATSFVYYYGGLWA
jgi:hypothetical protein